MPNKPPLYPINNWIKNYLYTQWLRIVIIYSCLGLANLGWAQLNVAVNCHLGSGPLHMYSMFLTLSGYFTGGYFLMVVPETQEGKPSHATHFKALLQSLLLPFPWPSHMAKPTPRDRWVCFASLGRGCGMGRDRKWWAIQQSSGLGHLCGGDIVAWIVSTVEFLYFCIILSYRQITIN